MLDTLHSAFSLIDIKVQQATERQKKKKNCSTSLWLERVWTKKEPWILFQMNEFAARDEDFSYANESTVQLNND